MTKSKRIPYQVKEDGRMEGAVLKHMRNVAHNTKTPFNEYDYDDGAILKAAEEKRARKAQKRLDKQKPINDDY